MKKGLYFILLAIELFVGACLMISLWDSSLYIPIAIAITAVLALSTWQIVVLSKTADVVLKKKILFRIALIMLLPIAVFALTYIAIGIVFTIAFAFGGF